MLPSSVASRSDDQTGATVLAERCPSQMPRLTAAQHLPLARTNSVQLSAASTRNVHASRLSVGSSAVVYSSCSRENSRSNVAHIGWQ